MGTRSLFEHGTHRNILLEDFGRGLSVQANQHLIVDGADGMILDPGGHKVYGRASSETFSVLGRSKLRYLFLSHQDPDIVAAANGWLMTTEADAYISALWIRFIPHFGLDELVTHRLRPIPDEGMFLRLGSTELMLLPAHFLHSEGNFQVYDPVSKILYSGDLGASLGQDYEDVVHFDTHVRYMEAFHRRYMVSNRILSAWVRMVRGLDIETIAPQHGAMIRGIDNVQRFLDWCETLECGIDLMTERLRLPVKPD